METEFIELSKIARDNLTDAEHRALKNYLKMTKEMHMLYKTKTTT
jgi:hypothetical protein